MGTKQSRILPTRVESVRRRFERWRRTRRGLSRIPERLWAAAVEMASTWGISPTAQALRVNYNALRKRVEQQAAAAAGKPDEKSADQRQPSVDGARSVPAFLELAAAPRVGSCQCTLELEDDSGAKMRIHLQGTEAPDLAALSRSFWEFRS
jgi:hypothetical protein